MVLFQNLAPVVFLDLVTMARTASSQRGQPRTKQELVLMLGIDKD